METTTSARPRRRSLFSRRPSSSDTRPNPALRHAKNASAPSLDPSPSPNYAFGPSASTDSLLSENGTRANIIPDALDALPSWYNKDIDVPSSLHLIRARYPIHNPAGPRLYRNVHLRPPELLHPMEAFTSTVPSAAASGSQAGPSSSSRTTSTSPAPTPASSSSKLVDPSIKPRTRKISNNVAHDNVDLLDVTDPLGNNWHHTSPYDALAAPSPVSPDGADPRPGPRSRLPSAASRPKTNAPSPLSQSTSAVHLAQEPEELRPKPKRRRTFKGVFSTKDDIDLHPHPTTSEPTTPFERGASPYLAVPPAGHKHKSSRIPRGLKSMSTTSIPHMATSLFGGSDKDKSAKREKRGSVLGRLARGFSVLRRPTHSRGSSDATGMSISDRMSMGTDPSRLSSVPPASGRHLSPEKGEARRRVPVPSVEPSTATFQSVDPAPSAPPERARNTQYSEYVYESDGRSELSVETPYSGGRLTIVNPDIPKPDEVEDSPVSTLMPLRATSPVARPSSVQVHVQAEIAGMARIQSIKRTSVEAPSAPHPPTTHSHAHHGRPPSQQSSSHSRSASSRLSSQHNTRHHSTQHAPLHTRLDKDLPVPASTPPPFITTEISTSPITLSRPLSVLSPPPQHAPELKPSISHDSHRSTRKPPSSSSSAPVPTPAPSHPTVPTPTSSTDTVTPTTTSISALAPAPTAAATPASPFRRDKAASQPMMSSPFLPFPTDLGTPLSLSSMLVNPPTPTAGPVPIPPVARIPSVFARRAKDKDAPSGTRSRGGSVSPTKHEEDEKERKEKEEREQRERERRAEKERLERERAELDRRVREKERELERERERALERDRLEKERLEVERRVREKEREIELERERERERRKAEEKEKERLERERERAAEKERMERERVELERRLWERAERERLERERQQREQMERERAEKERLDRERRREEERLEKEHRREEERRRDDERRKEKEERERWDRDERDRRERERSRERRRDRERSRERRKEREEREKEKERRRALEKEMHREEHERERERERARSRSPFAKRAVTTNGTVGSAKARETETFRLVRTLSGGNSINGTTIVAEGQHYEVVGDTPKRSKTASKEDPSRRVSRREKDKEREHRSEDSPAKPIVSPFSAHARSASSPVAMTRKDSSRRKPNEMPRLRERQPSVSSTSNRPTSDLPSAAELHAVRAKDAWEMDRLWRGHSAVYDPSLMYAQSIAAASTSTVQEAMPMSPPSGVHDPSPYMHGNLAAFTGYTPNYVFPSGLRSYPDLGSIPSIASPEAESLELRSPMRNPLPSPPKPSAYRLPPRVELKGHGLTVASS